MQSKKNCHRKPKTQKRDLKYREKTLPTEWACTVCGSLNSQMNLYCANCLQTLYYYNYINRHMFVCKDESYPHYEQPVEVKRKYSGHSWATNDTCDDDFASSDDESLSSNAI